MESRALPSSLGWSIFAIFAAVAADVFPVPAVPAVVQEDRLALTVEVLSAGDGSRPHPSRRRRSRSRRRESYPRRSASRGGGTGAAPCSTSRPRAGPAPGRRATRSAWTCGSSCRMGGRSARVGRFGSARDPLRCSTSSPRRSQAGSSFSRAEKISRPIVRPGGAAGPGVRFRLDVIRVAGEQSHPLESNVMDTFLGEPVEYSFRRGEGDGLESLCVSLRPTRLAGEVARSRSRSPGLAWSPEPDRRESPRAPPHDPRHDLFRHRDLGDGPDGYRFALTPDF